MDDLEAQDDAVCLPDVSERPANDTSRRQVSQRDRTDSIPCQSERRTNCFRATVCAQNRMWPNA